jgi:hypothetical protein
MLHTDGETPAPLATQPQDHGRSQGHLITEKVGRRKGRQREGADTQGCFAESKGGILDPPLVEQCVCGGTEGGSSQRLLEADLR